MKSLREALVHKHMDRVAPKDFIKPGAILKQRNGFCWYFDGKNLINIIFGRGRKTCDIESWMSHRDDNLVDISCPSNVDDYDIIEIYQPDDIIQKPNFEKVNKFIKTHSPVWVSDL